MFHWHPFCSSCPFWSWRFTEYGKLLEFVPRRLPKLWINHKMLVCMQHYVDIFKGNIFLQCRCYYFSKYCWPISFEFTSCILTWQRRFLYMCICYNKYAKLCRHTSCWNAADCHDTKVHIPVCCHCCDWRLQPYICIHIVICILPLMRSTAPAACCIILLIKA